MKSNYADKWLFEMASIESVGYIDTGIPDVQFVMVSGSVHSTSISEMWEIIKRARELGLKGLRINKYDYMSRGLIWYIWFAGSPEDVIMFSLKYEKTITISQERMTDLMDKISTLRALYSEEAVDVCSTITGVVMNQPIMIRIAGETRIIDISHLIDYTPDRH